MHFHEVCTSPRGKAALMKTRHTRALSLDDLLMQYECGAVNFSGDPNASYERHLLFDHVVEPAAASLRERFEAVALSLRDLLVQRWLRTGETYDRNNPKQVYYLSMEFLLGRSLTNNLSNLLLEPMTREVMQREGLDLLQLAAQEPDAGLGNGGLGRLAACFIDSLATLQMPAMGYGLRYNYGIFRQEIQNGYQVEHPDNWLRRPDPWEVARPRETVEVRVNATVHLQDGVERLLADKPSVLLGIPFDRPVVGYGGKTINTLRFRRRGNAWQALPAKVAIQLNDTHPAMAVAELMRILLDQAGLGWDEAWDLTTRTLAYTNHTLL